MLAELERPRFVVLALQRLDVGLACDLGVDDDAAAARHLDDEIRPDAPVVRRDMVLRLEVAVLEHPGHLDDAAELDLAPAAADVRPVAKRAHEVAGLAAQLLLRLGQLAHLLGERRVRALARDLELLELPVDLLQRLLERADEMLDGLFLLPELGGGQLEERLVVVAQRCRGERVESRREVALGLLEQGDLLRRPALLMLELDAQRRGLRSAAGGVCSSARAGVEPRGACADDQSDEESGDDHWADER